ncbi:hypothetical protein Z517_05904 [Fonsecaea pedrosoi CBS 271.37]|uniref:Unplaced genomic scaffold supercont1.4, whole genome shotgun sequence n=1 Tax=Fonsecaea pedrosoi CBS 271.37 TaxID=1442368 RepID=A0A0D2EYJ5_9EURO|nr:uncharacterized protein Z517_05904 [Fonsecaea pedrosoi CBS 271.37]KIW79292.1 hypothetical protein Z517_05904 [Fonsecaea pedrosoi CBS 271.37]
MTPMGHRMRDEHFLFEKGFVNLNHGSFGTYVKCVRDKLRSLQDAAEAAPDRYIRYEYPRLLDASRAVMAEYLQVPVGDVVYIANATMAVNAILRNLQFEEGDLIVYLDRIYGACEKTIDFLVETTPVESVKVEYTYPISDDDLVAKFQQTLASHKGKVKVALFETIASLPGVRLPFERLVAVARSEHVLSLVDGAHAVGNFPIDLLKFQPDFFISNCHKWLFAPRGCAVLYVPERNQHLMRSSLPTSHYFVPVPRPGVPPANNPLPPTGKSNFVSQFEFVGSVDNAPFLCLEEALRFRKEVCGGEAAIMKYCHDLAHAGGRRVAEILGTEVMDNDTHTLTKECCLVNVRLPLEVSDDDNDDRVQPMGNNSESAPDSTAADSPQRVVAKVPRGHVPTVTNFFASNCVTEHSTFIAFIFYHNAWWARFSAQVYLEMEDFEYGAHVIEALCQSVAQRAYTPTLPAPVACC